MRRGPGHPAARFARINTRHPNRSPSHPLFACAACLPAKTCRLRLSRPPSLSGEFERPPEIRQHPEMLSKSFLPTSSSATMEITAIVPRVTLRRHCPKNTRDRSFRHRRLGLKLDETREEKNSSQMTGGATRLEEDFAVRVRVARTALKSSFARNFRTRIKKI